MTSPIALVRPVGTSSPAVPSVLRWTALCAAAEAVGMTASAGAARAGQALADRPGPLGGTGVALAVVVAGGLVEGVALGSAQAWPLGRWLTSLRRGRYVLATVLVAGLGWAAASAPSVLAGGGDGRETPPLGLVLLGSDFPTIPYPYAHQLEGLERLGLGDDWLRAVCWGNGARLFA